jgi:uncharacterized protein (TIGR03382 family)
MKKLGMIGCFALASCLTASADDPTLTIQSGGLTVGVTLTSQGNGVWGIAAPISEKLSNGTSFTLNEATLDIDPSVHYAIGVTNADGSTGFTPYTFTFTTPTTLLPGLYAVSSSLGGSLTDGASDGVTLEPTSGYVQQALIGTNDAGVDLLNTSIIQTSHPATQVFGEFTGDSTYSLSSTASQISVQTNFQLSGNDSASLSGRFDCNAVPEPASAAMGFLAAGAFAVLLARGRRSRIA